MTTQASEHPNNTLSDAEPHGKRTEWNDSHPPPAPSEVPVHQLCGCDESKLLRAHIARLETAVRDAAQALRGAGNATGNHATPTGSGRPSQESILQAESFPAEVNDG